MCFDYTTEDLPAPPGNHPSGPIAAKIAAARVAIEATRHPDTGYLPVRHLPDRIPFGRYKGWLLQQIPTDYLRWALTVALIPDLRAAIEGELLCREFPKPPNHLPPISAEARSHRVPSAPPPKEHPCR